MRKLRPELYEQGNRYLQILTKNNRLGNFSDTKIYDILLRLEENESLEDSIKRKVKPNIFQKLEETGHNHYSILLETPEGELKIIEEDVILSK